MVAEKRTPSIFTIFTLSWVGGQGTEWEEPTLRDTINAPAWDGSRQYPTVTLRMDFRDANIMAHPFRFFLTSRPCGAPHDDGLLRALFHILKY